MKRMQVTWPSHARENWEREGETVKKTRRHSQTVWETNREWRTYEYDEGEREVNLDLETLKVCTFFSIALLNKRSVCQF